MKQDINLIVKKPVNAKALKGVLYFILLLLVLGALFFVATTIPNMMKNTALQKEKSLDQQISALTETKSKFDAINKQMVSLQQNLDILKELSGSKKDLVAILGNIEKNCPQAVTLTGIKFTATTIELDGTCDTDAALSALAVSLQKDSEYKSVIVNQTNRDSKSKMQNFIITMYFASPLKAEPVTVPSPTASASAQSSQSAGAEPSASASK